MERKQKEKNEDKKGSRRLRSRSRFLWVEGSVRVHKKGFRPAFMGAKRTVACKGKGLRVAGKRPKTSEHPVWTMSEADEGFARQFPGKPQARSDDASLISVSPGVLSLS